MMFFKKNKASVVIDNNLQSTLKDDTNVNATQATLFLNKEYKLYLFKNYIYLSIIILACLLFAILFSNIFPKTEVQQWIIFGAISAWIVYLIFKIIDNMFLLKSINKTKKAIKNTNKNSLYINQLYKKNKIDLVRVKWFTIFFITFSLLGSLIFYLVAIFPGAANDYLANTQNIVTDQFIFPFTYQNSIIIILSLDALILIYYFVFLIFRKNKMRSMDILLDQSMINLTDIDNHVKKVNRFYLILYLILITLVLFFIIFLIIKKVKTKKAK